jgi:hypothetical protein
MLNQNAVVLGIRDVRREAPAGTSKLLLDDERAVEVPGGEVDLLARADLLQWLGLPGILTLSGADAGAATVTTLDIPLVARILEISETPEGHLIEFDRSAARHLLAPARKALLDPLAAALEDGSLVIVQEDSYTHEILDMERASGLLAEATPALRLPSARRADGARVLERADAPPSELTRMTRRQADDFIRQMDTTESCGLPSSDPDRCIPFRYPDDGCFARAQRMCTLLLGQDVVPGKIWIYGQRLVHRTENHPACQIAWTWHVATVVADADSGEPLVLDPGLFDVAVDPVTWTNKMEDPTATSVFTTHEPFLRSRRGRITLESRLGISGRDEAESYLRIYRQRLIDRRPPPPFRCSV